VDPTLLGLSIGVFAGLCGFASWRLASLLHTEDAFGWLRTWIGIEHDEKGYPTIYPDTVWGSLFRCFWCLSLVVAVPVTAYVTYIARLPWSLYPVVWLASASVAVWLEKQIMHSHSR